jgi:hypothetical protein
MSELLGPFVILHGADIESGWGDCFHSKHDTFESAINVRRIYDTQPKLSHTWAEIVDLDTCKVVAFLCSDIELKHPSLEKYRKVMERYAEEAKTEMTNHLKSKGIPK